VRILEINTFMKAIKNKDGKNSESKFIEKIVFQEDFSPFKKWDQIKLNWETQVQELIEFYLKNENKKKDKLDQKSDEEIRRNAMRFKINCLLGGNWGGKSRLFNWIYNFLKRPSVWQPYWEKFIWKIIFNNWDNIEFSNSRYLYNGEWKTKVNLLVKEKWEFKEVAIISDNFFRLDSNIWYSENVNILKWNLAQFYSEFFNFLQDWEHKKDFAKFLNLSEDFTFYLEFKFELQYEFFRRNFLLLDELDKKFEKEEYEKTLDNVCYLYNFFQENTKRNNVDVVKSYFLQNIYFLLWIFHYFIWFEREYFLSRDKEKNEKLEKFVEIISFCLDELWVKNSFYKIYKQDGFLFDYFVESKDENIISYMKFFDISSLTESHHDFIINYWETNLIINIDTLSCFDKKIGFLTDSNIWKLDFYFNSKSFNDLSAWEKIINIRFINIYSKILEDKEKWKTNFIILIDEPDLHLHLDWQRKYIQKFIDVFSTLPEEINIHFIIATHSPFIISDLPWECIVKLQWDWKGNTEISYMDKKNEKTFWANFIDLIQDWFFFEDKNLMWSFAETIIWWLADDERKRILWKEVIDTSLKENIWDNFLKNNLVYFHKKDEKN